MYFVSISTVSTTNSTAYPIIPSISKEATVLPHIIIILTRSRSPRQRSSAVLSRVESSAGRRSFQRRVFPILLWNVATKPRSAARGSRWRSKCVRRRITTTFSTKSSCRARAIIRASCPSWSVSGGASESTWAARDGFEIDRDGIHGSRIALRYSLPRLSPARTPHRLRLSLSSPRSRRSPLQKPNPSRYSFSLSFSSHPFRHQRR